MLNPAVYALILSMAGAAPFLPLAAKPLRRHAHRGVRWVGGVLATFALWLTFNLSAMATWGAFHRDPSALEPALWALVAFQIPLAWLAVRVAFADRT